MPPECPTCGDAFSSSHGVKSHHKQVHGEQLETVPGTEAEPMECPTCGDEFPSERAVQIHHGHSHDGQLEPPIGCQQLHQLYVEEEWPTTKIADKHDVSATTVKKWMDRCDIEIRHISTAKAQGDISRVRDATWLREQYWGQRRTATDIADECSLDTSTVVSWLKRHGIDLRDRHGARADGNIEPLRDEDWLREQYWDKGRTTEDIGEQLGVSASTVGSWLRRHGIGLRDQHEAQADGNIAPLRDGEWLREQYWGEGRTATDIGEELGVYDSTVTRWLDRHDIETKGQSVARSGEAIRQLEDAEWLREQYHGEELTAAEIGSKVGVTGPCVTDWMERHGIERRGRKGEENPMWKGGTDDYYGPSWQSARRKARERDDYTCQRCGMTDAEHAAKYNQALHVHHIEPFRTFDDETEANKLSNLVTLCRDCHDRLEGVPIDFPPQ